MVNSQIYEIQYVENVCNNTYLVIYLDDAWHIQR